MEYKNFTYGSSLNDLGVVGHYTQMVSYYRKKHGHVTESTCTFPCGLPTQKNE